MSQKIFWFFCLWLLISPLQANWQTVLRKSPTTPEVAFGFGYQQALQTPTFGAFLTLADGKAFPDTLRYQAYAQALGILLVTPDYEKLLAFATRDWLPQDIRLLAISNAFARVQKEDSIEKYLNFMERFPNSAEAGLALLRVHELTYTAVLASNTVEKYDAFIAMFPGAKQIPDAKARAFSLAKEALVAKLKDAGFDLKNETSMALLIAAFEAETTENFVLAQRNYQLLEQTSDLQNTFGRLQYRKDQRDEARFQTLKQALVEQDGKINALAQGIAEQFQNQQQLIATGFASVDQRLDTIDQNKARQTQLIGSGFSKINQELANIQSSVYRVETQNSVILSYQTAIEVQNTHIQSQLQRQNWSGISSGLGLAATGLTAVFPVIAPFAPLIGAAVNIGATAILNSFF